MNKNGEAPIECSIIINGERVMFNLPMKAKPSDFNRKHQPKEIVDFIDVERTKIKTIVNEMIENNIPVNVINLREAIRNGGVRTYTVKRLFDDYMHMLAKRVDNDTMTIPVYKKYEFIKTKFLNKFNPNLECRNITNSMIKSFVTELYGEYNDSTAAGHATRLKSFIRYGMDNGHITINPFSNIKITKGWKPIEMLSDDDFNRICQKTFNIDRVDRVKDMFIFCCGSGLAYIDLKELTPEDFKEVDGQMCIIKQRHKTNNTFIAVLLPWAVEIAEKYNYDFRNVVISNQKMNAYLGEIKDICNVTSVKSLHTHLGRHFYCNRLLNLGIRPETVARAAGHSNYKTLFKHYAQIQEKTVVGEIKKIL